jgi:hypothetical protein
VDQYKFGSNFLENLSKMVELVFLCMMPFSVQIVIRNNFARNKTLKYGQLGLIYHPYIFSLCMYICMYLFIYLFMCVYIYVRVYVCIYVCMCVRMYVCMCVGMYLCVYVCMYVGMYLCVYVCMYVYMYVFLIRFIACSITFITTVILQAQYICLVQLLSLLLRLASPSV